MNDNQKFLTSLATYLEESNRIPRVWTEELRKIAKRQADETTASDHEDFMAYMEGELSSMKCCCEDGHLGTPPMMWPERIRCIAKRAAADAVEQYKHGPMLTWQEKLLHFKLLDPSTEVKMRKPDDWYVSSNFERANGHLRTAHYGNGDSPEAAVEDHARIYMDGAPFLCQGHWYQWGFGAFVPTVQP